MKTVRVAQTRWCLGVGTKVRLKSREGLSLKDRSARWIVLEISGAKAIVSDASDVEDRREFLLEDLEWVSRPSEKTHWVDVEIPSEEEAEEEDLGLYWGVDGFLHFPGDGVPGSGAPLTEDLEDGGYGPDDWGWEE